MKLGSEKEILEELDFCLKCLNEEKERDVRFALYNYIQNLHEFDNFTKNLRKNNIIELKNGYVIIKNEDIHRYIKAITLKITAEQSGFKMNTRKEDIGK